MLEILLLTMPPVDVIPYREEDGSVPPGPWRARLVAETRDRCLVRLALLEEHGQFIDRPVPLGAATALNDAVWTFRFAALASPAAGLR